MVELELPDAGVGDPEAAEDAASITPAHMVAHGRRDRIGSEDVPGSVGGGVATQHEALEAAQAAARLAATVSGSPITLFAGPWSQA